MKKTISINLILFLMITILFFNGCVKKETPDIIKIGVIGPFTGEGATYGAAMKRGIDLAFQERNEVGGVLGKEVKAIYEDSKLSAKDGINALTKLVNQDKVQVIIGAASSKVTLNLAPFAEKYKVVLISSISTADELKESGEYIFRNVPPNLQQGISAARFVNDYLKEKSAAVFFKNDDYGKSLAESFIKSFEKMNNNILIKESYQPNATDFKNQLIKIKEFEPKVIFFPGNYEDTGKILKQGRELGINSIFIGGDGSYSPELIRIAGKAAEGSYYTIMSLPSEESDKFSSFKKDFLAKYNLEPDVYSVYSYEAANIVIKAIENAGINDGTSIKKTLYNLKYDGITGMVEFDEYGEVNKDYSIYIIENGEFNLFYQNGKKI